jgi:hypothetical protein
MIKPFDFLYQELEKDLKLVDRESVSIGALKGTCMGLTGSGIRSGSCAYWAVSSSGKG